MTSTIPEAKLRSKFDVICFSHLRWDFVYQRPQHLMSRFAAENRVFFIEEPIESDGEDRIDISERDSNLYVCVPRLTATDDATVNRVLPALIAELLASRGVDSYIAWFYTPMMLEWSSRLSPMAVVYDCMDELAAFKNAPPELLPREQELFSRADLVFTGGQSLYEAKREQHHSVHAFPSSIDAAHFARAIELVNDVPEQAGIKRPRIGFAGVIDERMDINLLGEVADLRPDWQFVLVGPVVKIKPDSLPQRPNIHCLGQKRYEELPALMAGWDVAMMPFALNESTRFISPTKTPEYLAAGLPVVSTPIADVVRPYGQMGLVHIARDAAEFVHGIDAAMKEDRDRRLARVREFLRDSSWDVTFEAMLTLITQVISNRHRPQAADFAMVTALSSSNEISISSRSAS